MARADRPCSDILDRVTYLAEHLRHMRREGRAQRTIDVRTDVMLKLAVWLEDDPAYATQQELERWQDSLLGTSPNWMRWSTTVIRPYYRFVHRRGYRPDDPTALLVLPRKSTALPKPMSEADVMRMIDEAPPRLLPWLLLAGWCGLRAVEIARLRGEDFTIDHEARAWVTVRGKGDRSRQVPIALWMWPLLEPYLPDVGPCWARERGTGPVTPRHVSQLCAKFLHSIGITETLHSLRHRVATVTLRQSGNLRTVQELLGHADLSSLHIYTRVNSADVADALDAIPQPRQSRGEVHRLRPRCADER